LTWPNKNASKFQQINRLSERMEESYEQTREKLPKEIRPDLKDTYQNILMQDD